MARKAKALLRPPDIKSARTSAKKLNYEVIGIVLIAVSIFIGISFLRIPPEWWGKG